MLRMQCFAWLALCLCEVLISQYCQYPITPQCLNLKHSRVIDLGVILLGQSCCIKECLQYLHCIGHCSTCALDISIGHQNPIVSLLDLCHILYSSTSWFTMFCMMLCFVMMSIVSLGWCWINQTCYIEPLQVTAAVKGPLNIYKPSNDLARFI